MSGKAGNTTDKETITPGEAKTPSGSITPDFSYVDAIARVAVYDGAGAAPKVLEVMPDDTDRFIERLTVVVDDEAKRLGGKIPYSTIRQGVENLIHARFHGCVVSIMDGGNTVRIADHGPGIKDVENAVKPGYTSAVEGMQGHIRGVGSGIPLMVDYVRMRNGHIDIDSNIDQGTVLTISIDPDSPDDRPVLEYRQNGGDVRRAFGDTRDGKEVEGVEENTMNRYDARAAGDSYSSSPRPSDRPAQPLKAQPVSEPPARPVTTTPSPYQQAQQQPMATPNAAYAYNPYQPSGLQQSVPPAVHTGMPPQTQTGAWAPSPYYGQPVYQGVQPAPQGGAYRQPPEMLPHLNDNEQYVMALLRSNDPHALGPSDVERSSDIARSSAYNVFESLAKQGLVEKTDGRKRVLTAYGKHVADELYRMSTE